MSNKVQNQHDNAVADFMREVTALSEKCGLHLTCNTMMKLRDNDGNGMHADLISWIDGEYE